MFRIVKSLGAGGVLPNRCLGLRVERARQGRSRVSEKDCPVGEQAAPCAVGCKVLSSGHF